MHKLTITPDGAGHLVVECDEGCKLGTSAIQDTQEGAERRAKLHEIATDQGWYHGIKES